MSTYNQTKAEIQEELQMIEKAKADPDPLVWWYNKYYNRIYLFVFKRTGDEKITDDITSAVFLKAMVNIKKYVFKGVPFSAWLYRTAINEVNFYFRKAKATRTISLDQSNLANVLGELDDNDGDERTQFLLAAMGKLPDEMMQLLELRFFENRSFREVGEILGITENNAKVKVYRIIDKLKKIMKIK